MTKTYEEFSENDIQELSPDEKMGIFATINSKGLPHISLITTAYAKNKTQLILGEFSKGLSKKNMEERRNTAFILLTLDKSIWRGRAAWTHKEKSGPDFEMMNNVPMFRYNTYFGVDTVHYFDIKENSGKEKLPMGGIVLSALLTKIAKGGTKKKGKGILTTFGETLFNGMGTLKFISYVGGDGFPVLIPLIQCQAAGSDRLAFSDFAYGHELGKIIPGTDVAVYGLNMKMESLLVRGKFSGYKRVRGIRTGSVDIDWVYNSMPPAHGQIYPETVLKAVENF